MGWLRDVVSRFTAPIAPAKQFHNAPIDHLIAEMSRGSATSVTRTEALSVPAVQRGRNMLCSIATLPLVQHGPDRSVVANPLFTQLDPDVANVVTLSQTVEDLLFDGISWWRITAFGWDGFPTEVRHLDVGTVSVTPPANGKSPNPLPSGIDPRDGVVYVDGKPVLASEMIRFDSPNPAVLTVGGRAIRRALLLDQAAAMYAEDPRPLDYFTPGQNADPLEDDEVTSFLGRWKTARKTRSTAYIPASVDYNTVDSPSPADLQLAELQKQASLDIANALGIDPEDLGVSTTSRTYANAVDRRRDRINDVLAPFMRAITDRLSMGDVTKRGYYVAFDLDDFMKSNPTERANVQKTYLEMGVLTVDEIRAEEGLPVRSSQEPTQSAVPEPQTVTASRPPILTFDSEPNGLRHFNLNVAEFAVDTQARTITGTVMPYGPVAAKYGMQFRFAPASLKWSDLSRVKLNRDHDVRQSIGYATAAQDTGKGLKLTFKVARGPEGDAALQLAEDGVLDGLSAGVEFTDADTIPDPKTRGVTLVRRADLRHAALTAEPAFDDARVTRVHASRNEGTEMPETETTTEPTPTAPVAAPAHFDAATVVALLNAMNTNQSAGISATLGPAAEPETRQVVNPTRQTASVTEPVSYRFDRRGILTPAAHDFGMDLVVAARSNNPEGTEYRRVMEFVRAQFDVVSTDVNELNPTINMPRYIDQRDFTYPIWNAVNKGAPPNGIQPFSWPKFSSASGLVAAHTEGTEPSSGTYVTTSQTVTPTPLSGKCKVSREVWDMGGVPGLSDLVWRQMLRGWFEALEAAIVTELNAASPTSLGTFTAGGGTTGQTLASEMRQYLAQLHFVRGGFRFDTTFAQIDLYTHLTNARDGQGRPLFPAIGPTNADGTVDGRYQSININGVPFLPTWALAATGSVAASSYLIDRGAVDGWASAPQRLNIDDTEVANVYIGLFGYKATAINDINGVRELIYDPVA